VANNSLVSHRALLKVVNGQFFVAFELGDITVQGVVIYLKELKYLENGFSEVDGVPSIDATDAAGSPVGTLKNAKTLSRWFVSTTPNPTRAYYPRWLEIPINETGSYFPVWMNVPGNPAGDHKYAWLHLDWTSLRTTPDSLTGSLKTIYVKKGSTVTVPVMVNGSASDATTLTWTSSKPKVASIVTKEASGTKAATINKVLNLKIKGAGAGTSQIALSHDNGKKIAFKIVVVKQAKALKSVKLIAIPSGKQMKVGVNKQLGIKLSPAKATISGTAVTWKSSNPKVLSVDAAGKITAHRVGTASISVKIGKKTATAKLTVKK
jgi:hypothetical protein